MTIDLYVFGCDATLGGIILLEILRQGKNKKEIRKNVSKKCCLIDIGI